MIVFRTPKGWTCPPEIDGKKCEGYWRSHQVPMGDMEKPEHIRILEQWMKSYRPEELFDKNGRLKPEIAELAPKGHRRMSDNPHANGGLLMHDLKLPDFRDYAVEVPSPGATTAESARVMGKFLRDVMKLNLEARTFGCSARTRTTRIAGRTCSKSPRAATWPKSIRKTTSSARMVASWKCSASTNARAGWKATC